MVSIKNFDIFLQKYPKSGVPIFRIGQKLRFLNFDLVEKDSKMVISALFTLNMQNVGPKYSVTPSRYGEIWNQALDQLLVATIGEKGSN